MNGHSDSWCYLSYCLGQRWTLGPWHNSWLNSSIKYAAFFLEKGILSKMKGGHCDMTPSSNLISPRCLSVPLCVPLTWTGLTSLSLTGVRAGPEPEWHLLLLRGSDTRSRLSLGSVITRTQTETDGVMVVTLTFGIIWRNGESSLYLTAGTGGLEGHALFNKWKNAPQLDILPCNTLNKS